MKGRGLVTIGLLGLLGCTSFEHRAIDPAQAQAQAERPVQAEVVPVVIARDVALPDVVVVILGFATSASALQAGSNSRTAVTLEDVGVGVASQLATTLHNVGNIQVVKHDFYQANPAAAVKAGERGPYLVSGVVTEFNPNAGGEVKKESKGPGFGTMLFFPEAAVFGKRTSREHSRRVGMVGLTIQISGPDGRQVAAFTATGQFETLGEVTRNFGLSGADVQGEFAASGMGQATQAAVNEAAVRIHDELVKPSQVATRQ